MAKKTFLDVLDKSLKKRLRERPEDETLDDSEWVVMPEKKAIRPIETTDEGEIPVRCLGNDCEYASYKKDKEGRTVLWCSMEHKGVYDIQRCPVKKWYKDKSGKFIIEGKGL
jgi:hypothetical protein